MTTREQIWQALFDLLTTTTTQTADGQVVRAFEYTSRRVTLLSDGSPETPISQPAMMLVEGNETRMAGGRGQPDRKVLHGFIWVWARIADGPLPSYPDANAAGSSVLNPLLDAVDVTLTPIGADLMRANTLTLGQLVSHCWVEGETIKVSGDLNPDGQCFASIPIHILIP